MGGGRESELLWYFSVQALFNIGGSRNWDPQYSPPNSRIPFSKGTVPRIRETPNPVYSSVRASSVATMTATDNCYGTSL